MMIRLFLSAMLLTLSLSVNAAEKSKATRGPASVMEGGGKTEVDKPLNITGQTRNLSIMRGRNSKNEIDFANSRHKYRDEILKTKF